MLKKILIVIVIALAALSVGISLQPDEFRVSRSTIINAQPETVFPLINEFHNWEGWSPWAKLDPNAKTIFEGPSAGLGSKMVWEGNHEVGTGSITITESRPYELVQMRLDFLKPFESTSNAEFTLLPQGNGTQVTWTMYGKNNFISKTMSLFMDCEKMVGEQFDKGLASIKEIAEKQEPK